VVRSEKFCLIRDLFLCGWVRSALYSGKGGGVFKAQAVHEVVAQRDRATAAKETRSADTQLSAVL